MEICELLPVAIGRPIKNNKNLPIKKAFPEIREGFFYRYKGGF
jgi:hypothetical protein